MKVLLDAHLPARLAGEFTALDTIMISKDANFIDLARRGVLQVPLVRVRLGNITSIALYAAFRSEIPHIAAALQADETIIEIQ